MGMAVRGTRNEWKRLSMGQYLGFNSGSVPDKGHLLRGPDPVDLHPSVQAFWSNGFDRNVWQWTDEFVDEHTRSAILKEEAIINRKARYGNFVQAYKLEEHGKLLLMAPSYDRSVLSASDA